MVSSSPRGGVLKAPEGELWCVVSYGDDGGSAAEAEFFQSESAAIQFARGVLAADGLSVYVMKVHWVL